MKFTKTIKSCELNVEGITVQCPVCGAYVGPREEAGERHKCEIVTKRSAARPTKPEPRDVNPGRPRGKHAR